MGCCDIEQDNFVRALAGVTRGLCSRITGVNEVNELNAFDDTAITAVKASNDAAGQQGRNSRKFFRILKPASPDFSG